MPSALAHPAAYDALGVSADASADEIKRAYRALSKTHHPDRPGADAEAFRRVAAAYELVGSPQARAAYDATGKAAIVAARIRASMPSDDDVIERETGVMTASRRDAKRLAKTLGKAAKARSVRAERTVTQLTADAWALKLTLSGRRADVEAIVAIARDA